MTVFQTESQLRKVAALDRARPHPRTSDLLKNILASNPDAKVFTFETIVRALGEDRFEPNLVFLTLPTLPTVSGKPMLSSASAALAASQMATGRATLSLPPAVLNQEIPRRSLAVAIHAALPLIEATEKVARPRLGWLNRPICRRIIATFLFILAAAAALPLVGFNPLQSLSTFVISLGIAEGDGAAILLGVAVGVLSLALIAGSIFSVRAMRRKAASWVSSTVRKFGGSILARFCQKTGLAWIGRILTFDWTDILMLWNPERKAAAAQPPVAPRPAARAEVTARRERARKGESGLVAA